VKENGHAGMLWCMFKSLSMWWSPTEWSAISLAMLAPSPPPFTRLSNQSNGINCTAFPLQCELQLDKVKNPPDRGLCFPPFARPIRTRPLPPPAGNSLVSPNADRRLFHATNQQVTSPASVASLHLRALLTTGDWVVLAQPCCRR
jgi:hypothetical protein